MSTQVSTIYSAEPGSIEAEIEAALRAEKERIGEEIRQYPHPIPTCDAQFNYLIEQRNQVKQELNQLHSITAKGRVDTAALQVFIDKSKLLDRKAIGAWRLGGG